MTYLCVVCSLFACRVSDDDFPAPPPETTTTSSVPSRAQFLTCRINGEFWKAAREFYLFDSTPKVSVFYQERDSTLTIRANNNKNGNDERFDFFIKDLTPDSELPATFEMVQDGYIFINDHWRDNPQAAPGGYYLNTGGSNTVTITHFTEDFIAGTFKARLHHFRNGNFILNVKEGKFDIRRGF